MLPKKAICRLAAWNLILRPCYYGGCCIVHATCMNVITWKCHSMIAVIFITAIFSLYRKMEWKLDLSATHFRAFAKHTLPVTVSGNLFRDIKRCSIQGAGRFAPDPLPNNHSTSGSACRFKSEIFPRQICVAWPLHFALHYVLHAWCRLLVTCALELACAFWTSLLI